MSGKKLNTIKKQYYLRLLGQRNQLLRVVEELRENIKQLDREIDWCLREDYVFVPPEGLEGKSYFHLEKPEKEEPYP